MRVTKNNLHVVSSDWPYRKHDKSPDARFNMRCSTDKFEDKCPIYFGKREAMAGLKIELYLHLAAFVFQMKRCGYSNRITVVSLRVSVR